MNILLLIPKPPAIPPEYMLPWPSCPTGAPYCYKVERGKRGEGSGGRGEGRGGEGEERRGEARGWEGRAGGQERDERGGKRREMEWVNELGKGPERREQGGSGRLATGIGGNR